MRPSLLLTTAFIAACSDHAQLIVRTVSEYTGVPIEGARVQVDAQPWSTTAADGEAVFDAAAEPFTIRVHQSYGAPSGNQYDKVFVLRDRRGSVVVAEVDGTPGWHRGQVDGAVNGRAGVPSSVVVVQRAVKNTEFSTLAASDGTFNLSPVEWQGEAATTLTLRAIESDAANPPGHYYGYGSADVAVSAGGTTAGASLALHPVSEGSVTGSVAAPAVFSAAGVSGRLWLAFSDYDLLVPPQSGPSVGTEFSFVLPVLNGAVAWIELTSSAEQGSPSLLGARSWHRRRVGVPAIAVAFDLPEPVQLIEPAHGASVGTSSVFRWSPGPPGGSHTFFLHCEWMEGGIRRTVGYRGIETAADTQVSLPAIPGLALATGATCRWSVSWCAVADPAVESRCASSAEWAATVL